jgi:asparagine synthase (glutamine-hydrolysing)
VSTEPSVIRGFSIVPAPVAPGHVVTLKGGALESRGYCDELARGPFSGDIDAAVDRIEELLKASLKVRLKDYRSVAVAFSGGLDSSLLAQACSRRGKVLLVSTFAEGSKDAASVKGAADELGLDLHTATVDRGEVARAVTASSDDSDSRSPMDRALAAGFYLTSVKARNLGMELLVAGQGADEIFGGYSRHLETAASDPKALIPRLVQELPRLEAGLRRDELAIASGGCEASFPYADFPIARFSLSLPSEYLISNGVRKVILRRLARKWGLPPSIAEAEKKAFQYSSGIQNLV